MAIPSIKKFQLQRDAVKIGLGWARVELLPSAPYSICDASRSCVLGLALERQRGVHAIGSDTRQDFDAWPGDVAVTSPGVNIFSESSTGGEYLAVQMAHGPQLITQGEARVIFHGDRRAVRTGVRLRRLMLAGQPDEQAIEEQVAFLVNCATSLLQRPGGSSSNYDLDRKIHSRILDYIDAEISRPLGLEELAQLAGMPLLRFLRSFAHAAGMTPHAYITERRMQRARLLLRATDQPVAAIAADCGFTHQSHLGALFKARLGLSPHAYRLRGRGAMPGHASYLF